MNGFNAQRSSGAIFMAVCVISALSLLFSGCNGKNRADTERAAAAATEALPELRASLDSAESALALWADARDPKQALARIDEAVTALDSASTTIAPLAETYATAVLASPPGAGEGATAQAASAYSTYAQALIDLRDSAEQAAGFTRLSVAGAASNRLSSSLLKPGSGVAGEGALRRQATKAAKLARSALGSSLHELDPSVIVGYKGILSSCDLVARSSKPSNGAVMACFGASGRLLDDVRARTRTLMTRMQIASARMSSTTERLEKLRLETGITE